MQAEVETETLYRLGGEERKGALWGARRGSGAERSRAGRRREERGGNEKRGDKRK